MSDDNTFPHRSSASAPCTPTNSIPLPLNNFSVPSGKEILYKYATQRSLSAESPSPTETCNDAQQTNQREMSGFGSLAKQDISQKYESLMSKEFEALQGNHYMIPFALIDEASSRCINYLTREQMSQFSQIGHMPGLKEIRLEIEECTVIKFQSFVNEAERIDRDHSLILDKALYALDRLLSSNLPLWAIQCTKLPPCPTTAKQFIESIVQKMVLENSIVNSKGQPLLLQKLFESENVQRWLTLLQNLSFLFDEYRTQMESKFRENVIFTDSKLERYHSKLALLLRKNQELLQLEDEVQSFINALEIGIENFILQYTNRNGVIREAEIKMGNELIARIEKDFKRQVVKLMTKRINPVGFNRALCIITEEFCNVVRKALEFIAPLAHLDLEDKIREKLSNLGHSYELRNTRNCNRDREKVSSVLLIQRKLYNSTMEIFLPRRGPSRDRLELLEKHKAVLDESKGAVRKELCNLAGFQIEENVLLLNAQIEKDFIEIESHNEELAEVEKSREEGVHKMVQEEVRKKQVENLDCVSTSESPDLPPIAVEFAIDEVRVGYYKQGTFQLILSDSGEDSTLKLLSVDSDNQIHIGNSALNHKPVHNIDHLFSDVSKLHLIAIDGIETPVRMEVIVGMFFHKLKKNIELELEASWNSILVTLPLHYHSIHRQCVRDAVFLAGFKNCHLLNDTSAMAFYFAYMPSYIGPGNKYLLSAVGTESYFNCGIYSLHSGRVEMIHSCGSHHATAVPGSRFMASASRWLGFGVRNPSQERVAVMLDDFKYCNVNLAYSFQGNKSWLNLFLPYVQRRVEDKKYFVVKGAALLCLKMTTLPKDEVEGLVLDKTSYECHEFLENTDKSRLIFNTFHPLKNPGGIQRQISHGNAAKGIIQFYAHSAGHWYFIGKLNLSMMESLTNFQLEQLPFQLKYQAAFSGEGIFRLDSIEFELCSCSVDTKDVKLVWTTKNLERKQLRVMPKIEDMLKTVKSESVRKARLNLEEIIGRIKPKIGNVQSLIGKTALSNLVKDIEVLFNHPKTSVDTLTDNFEQLKLLVAKYIDK